MSSSEHSVVVMGITIVPRDRHWAELTQVFYKNWLCPISPYIRAIPHLFPKASCYMNSSQESFTQVILSKALYKYGRCHNIAIIKVVLILLWNWSLQNSGNNFCRADLIHVLFRTLSSTAEKHLLFSLLNLFFQLNIYKSTFVYMNHI